MYFTQWTVDKILMSELYIFIFSNLQTRCSQGCSTNSLVILLHLLTTPKPSDLDT